MPRKPINRAHRLPATSTHQRWFDITNNTATPGTAEIRLRGYIGEATTRENWRTGQQEPNPDGAGTLGEFEAALIALGDVQNLTLSIFSEGGDVFTGMAIHNVLMRHPANKICIIDGICASAATYPAMACQEIRIPANAWMMIHGSSLCICGNAAELRDAADQLDSIDSTLVNLYVARTGKSEDEVRAMLATDTWMNGSEAVENGFADTALAALQNMAARAGTLQPSNVAMLRNAPAEALALFDMRNPSPANANTAPTPTMIRRNAPLMTPADAGGAVSPPAAPAAVTPPANAAVVVPPVVTPPAAVPAAATPTNAAPSFSLADITTAITGVVKAAVAPLQERLAIVEGQRAAGISPANLAGAAPATGVTPPEAPKTLDIKNMSAMQLINLGRKQAKPTISVEA